MRRHVSPGASPQMSHTHLRSLPHGPPVPSHPLDTKNKNLGPAWTPLIPSHRILCISQSSWFYLQHVPALIKFKHKYVSFHGLL